ncbi:DUF3365 domain-containing protein [Crocinitomicaceae bacterium]|nr:DUF3365 domain-containing protein [Crocinitomicaceae bacterium]
MQRYLQFSLRAFFVLVSLACVWLAWTAREIRKDRIVAYENIVDHALVDLHWVAWETDPQNKALISEISDSLGRGSRLRCRFLRPNGLFTDGESADEYEKLLLSQMAAAPTKRLASEEGIERWINGRYVYYRTVLVRKNCLKCHEPGTPAIGKRPNRLMAIVKVE